MKTLTTFILTSLTVFCINTVSAQWVQQYNTGGTARSGSFINSNTGWYSTSSGILSKTTNGGTNWQTVLFMSGENFRQVHFMNENTGLIFGSKLLKTTDGGLNWTEFLFLPGGNGFIPSTIFVNNSTGWACSFFSGKIFKTTDGGNTWPEQNSGTTEPLTSIFFLNTSTGWYCGDNGAAGYTTNGGTNWHLTNTGTTDQLVWVHFTDANNGKMVSEENNFFKTTNGGQTWYHDSINGFTFTTSVHFVNPTSGWITGSHGILFTSNNGASWINHVNPNRVYSFEFVEGIIYAIGSYIYKTTNGGFNLTAPSNLTATAVSTSRINLSWTDNSDEDKFMILRNRNNTVWELHDSVAAGVTSYADTGLTITTIHTYYVYAKKLFFTGEYSNWAATATLLDSLQLLSPADNYISPSPNPVLTWTPTDFTNSYLVLITQDTNFSPWVDRRFILGPTTSYTVNSGILQNSKEYYWRVKSMNFESESNYSSYRKFTVQDPNYGHNIATGNSLYYFANSTSGANLSPSKPTFNWRDTTGSIDLVLNRTAIAPLAAGNLNNGRFDLTGILPGSNSIRFFGTDYQNVYIGTNGIIGFNTFTPTGTDFAEPTSLLPQANITNAIFPLWYNTNFQDTDVPVNRLCYKVTSNELIITFSKVPSNGADANDYVSFQVIINHSDSPVLNSAIKIQYNYDETGSTFITRYNANTLTSHMIGLQGANSDAQCFQYRYLNSTPQLMSSGPMFSSNLAVQFGPNIALLPVELSSFTSQVNGNSVKLNWATASELNNSGFEIERKNSESNDWKKISFVQGNGTTNDSKNYFYDDKNITSGKYQYRLKQKDFNGNYEYHTLSNEVEIGIPKKFNLSQNYPNPFNPATKINFEIPRNLKVQLSVYDVTGKLASELVNEQRAAGYYTVEFNGSNLASGMYFYLIEAGEFSATKKMILVK